jgi:hypothetical protein
MTLTIFFEQAFWKALIQRVSGGSLSTATHIFGSEPTDIEVDEWIRKSWDDLLFSPAVPFHEPESTTRTTRKGATRIARKSLKRSAITPEIREAARAQRQLRKKESAKESRAKEQLLSEHKRELKARRAKERHRGH